MRLRALKQMFADAEKAVALDPQDCELLGYTRLRARATRVVGRRRRQQFRSSVEMCPANSHTLILAACGFSYIGKAEEGAGFADRALRLDPRMTPANLSGVKDAYYMAHRYEDTIDAVMRMPEEQRHAMLRGCFLPPATRGSAERKRPPAAKSKLLKAFPLDQALAA